MPPACAARCRRPTWTTRRSSATRTILPALRRFGSLDVNLLSIVDFSDEMARLLPQGETQREHNLLATYQREVAADLERHVNATVHSEVLWGDAAQFILDQALPPDRVPSSKPPRPTKTTQSSSSAASDAMR